MRIYTAHSSQTHTRRWPTSLLLSVTYRHTRNSTLANKTRFSVFAKPTHDCAPPRRAPTSPFSGDHRLRGCDAAGWERAAMGSIKQNHDNSTIRFYYWTGARSCTERGVCSSIISDTRCAMHWHLQCPRFPHPRFKNNRKLGSSDKSMGAKR